MRLIQIRPVRRNLSLALAVAGVAFGSAVGWWLKPKKGVELKPPSRWRRRLMERQAKRSQVIDAVVPPSEDVLEDDLVAEIVRSELGRVCSHPDALRVS